MSYDSERRLKPSLVELISLRFTKALDTMKLYHSLKLRHGRHKVLPSL